MRPRAAFPAIPWPPPNACSPRASSPGRRAGGRPILSTPESPGADPASPSPAPDRPARILIIEDSTTYRKILKTYFEREGFGVLTAATGEEGLTLVESDRPDLIVVDFMLPGILGDEVCSKIKLDTELRGIPVVMLTSRSRQKDITAGLDAGADDYVVKSGDIDILLLRVRNLLRTRERGDDHRPAHSSNLAPRVLSIDDDEFFSRYLTNQLQRDGYQIVAVHSGLDGLEAVRRSRFDCIIVDFIMPGMTGDEVCRRLKSDESTRDIPVVLLTTRADRQDMIAGLNAGADDYILKTIDRDVLRSRIQAQLRRKHFQDENRRILEELKAREVETTRARLDRDLAEAKARMADQLRAKNVELSAVNAKLRTTQALMIQTEKMAALGLVVAGIAHEINNPLAYVRNNLETIERDLQDLDQIVSSYREVVGLIADFAPDRLERIRRLESELEYDTLREEIRRFMADSMDGVDHIKNIVINLRNFSRLDEGEVQVVDLTEGIRSTLKIIDHLLEPSIEIEEDYGAIPRIECYPGLLNQVFMNILVNACHAVGASGKITIRTFQRDDRVHLAFSDTGSGMPPEVMAKIFDPFFTTKGIGSGTGLGLSTSYGIVQKHGGDILVESQPGRGSTFTVVLPRSLPVEPPEGAHEPTEGP